MELHLKFKLGDKVYFPRICREKRTLLDIREYYIVRIDISLDKYQKVITYYASPNKENIRGKRFFEGEGIFSTYDKAMQYATKEGCKYIC